MCIQCHNSLSDNFIVKSLKTALATDDSQFDDWNSTSVGHTIICAAGINGKEARILSLELLKRFLGWYRLNKEDCYFPIYGMSRMISLDDLYQQLTRLYEFDESLLTDCQINNKKVAEEFLESIFNNQKDNNLKSYIFVDHDIRLGLTQ